MWTGSYANFIPALRPYSFAHEIAPPEVTAKSMYLHRHHPVFRTFRFNHRLTAYSLRRTHGVLLFQKAWDSTTGDLRKCELITHSQNIKLQIHSSPSRQHCRRANEVSHTLIWFVSMGSVCSEKKKKKTQIIPQDLRKHGSRIWHWDQNGIIIQLSVLIGSSWCPCVFFLMYERSDRCVRINRWAQIYSIHTKALSCLPL